MMATSSGVSTWPAVVSTSPTSSAASQPEPRPEPIPLAGTFLGVRLLVACFRLVAAAVRMRGDARGDRRAAGGIGHERGDADEVGRERREERAAPFSGCSRGGGLGDRLQVVRCLQDCGWLLPPVRLECSGGAVAE